MSLTSLLVDVHTLISQARNELDMIESLLGTKVQPAMEPQMIRERIFC